MKKIAFISFSPLTNGILENYCISDLIIKGLTVEYYFLKNLYKNISKSTSQNNSDIIVAIDNYRELKKAINSNDNSSTKYILLLHLELRTLPIYILLSTNNAFMIFLAWGQFFSSSKSKVNIFKKIKNNYKKLGYLIINKIVLKIVHILHIVKPFDLIFASGSIATQKYQHHKKIIQFNYFDYDKNLKAKDINYKLEPYILFLDINLPYHSDQKMLGIQPINPEIYFASMNRYFNKIEKETSMKVIIAAHPKSQYDKKVYGGRKIIINETNNLVKNSSIVLSHTSSSFVYAVLYKKPLVFLYSDEISKVYPDIIIAPINNWKEQLNCYITNIDNDGLSYSHLTVNSDLYDKFKYKYITSEESEKKFNAEILYKELINE